MYATNRKRGKLGAQLKFASLEIHAQDGPHSARQLAASDIALTHLDTIAESAPSMYRSSNLFVWTFNSPHTQFNQNEVEILKWHTLLTAINHIADRVNKRSNGHK